MVTKEFIHQRICIFSGKDFDPNIDEEVKEILSSKFNIRLPQRTSMNDSLASTRSDHEIIRLIYQYRTMN